MSFCARYSFEKHCKEFNDRPRSSQTSGAGARLASDRFLPNTAFLTASSEPQFPKINRYDVMGIFLP